MIKNAKIAGTSVNPEDYHVKTTERGNLRFPVSSSTLREFATCPARWIGGYEPPDSESKAWGSLLDAMLLTPRQFKQRYAVKPATYKNEKGEEKPWNGNSNVCKQWLSDHADKVVVSGEDEHNAERAIIAMRTDSIIADFLDASDVQVMVTAEWHDEKTGLIVPLRCLIDLVPRNDSEFCKCLADLKTTRNAALMPWQRWCFTAGYHIQAAFNRAMYCAAMPDEDRNTFCFILQENYSPWQTGKRMLSQDFLTLGTADYTRLMENYCQCLKTNKWPSYDDTDEAIQGSWSLVSPEPWMAAHAEFAPKMSFGNEQEQTEENADVPMP